MTLIFENQYIGMDRAALGSHENDLNAAKKEMAAAMGAIDRHLNMIEEAKKKAPPVSNPIITDHAVLRYLERVKGVDTNMIRAQIAEDMTAGVKLKNGMIRGRQKETYVINGERLTTVLPTGPVTKSIAAGKVAANG